MTTTPLDYFDKVPGTLEQLVLGVITQKLINQDYLPDLLVTDFTTNAINWSVTADSGDSLSIGASLSLSLTFPTLPYERQILTDRDSFDKRIMSINALSADTLSLPQKPNYPIKSTPAKLPKYLSEAVPENILERRLMALCLHIRNYLNWIERWNTVAIQWRFAKYSAHWNTNPNITYPVYDTIPLAELERQRDDLLSELASAATFKQLPSFNITAILPAIAASGNPATAKELINFFGGAEMLTDPGNDSSPPLSTSLLKELEDAAQGNKSNNQFSSNSPDAPTQKQPEVPTLPNC
jgi:hypothetical protein